MTFKTFINIWMAYSPIIGRIVATSKRKDLSRMKSTYSFVVAMG